MKLRNKETGEVESLHYGPAQEAVKAGTHDFIDPADANGTSAEAAEAIQAGAASGDQVNDGAQSPASTETGGDQTDGGDGNQDGEINPASHSKDELLEIAEQRGVDADESMTKAEIADAINAAS